MDVDHPEPAIRALERDDRLALAQLDLGAVGEVGGDPGVLDPRDRFQGALGAIGVGSQHRRAEQLLDDRVQRRLVRVDGSLDLDVLDREQRRPEHGQRGDGEQDDRRRQGDPPQALAAGGALARRCAARAGAVRSAWRWWRPRG